MSKLFNKYIVYKSDGSPINQNAQYFVLRIDTDPAARAALLVYADQIKDSDPGFSKELQAWVWAYTENASNTGLHSGQACTCHLNFEGAIIKYHRNCPIHGSPAGEA